MKNRAFGSRKHLELEIMFSSSYLVLLVISCLLPYVLSDYEAGEFDDQEQKEMVDAHNFYRTEEKAANMNKLKWNKVLAKMAYNFIQECKYEHGQPDEPESPFSTVGQNIYLMKPYKKLPYKHIVGKWLEEKKYYNFDDQSCSKECGHYTQVVWSDTTLVGCATKNCSLVTPNKMKDAFLLLCNYAPGGNNPDTNPYEVGDVCSMCEESSPCEDGLCNYDYTY